MPLGNDTCTHVESGRFSRQLLRTVHTAEIPFHDFFFFFFSRNKTRERRKQTGSTLALCGGLFDCAQVFREASELFKVFLRQNLFSLFLPQSKNVFLFFLFLSPWKYLRKMCDHHHVSLDSLEWSMEWRAPSSLTFFFFSLGCWGESFDPDYEKPFPLLFRSNVKYYWSITFFAVWL